MNPSNSTGKPDYHEQLRTARVRLNHVAGRKKHLKYTLTSLRETIRNSASRISKTRDVIQTMRDELKLLH